MQEQTGAVQSNDRAHRFDLHSHSNYSDGTATPSEIVKSAFRAGLDLIALSDHDTIGGVKEAMETGEKLGISVLPAVEMDNEWRHELHILGLDVDPDSPVLNRALEIARIRREKRNGVILQKLDAAGIGVRDRINRPLECTSKLHIAIALVEAGLAKDIRDAFAKYLRQGQVGFYQEPKFTPAQVLEIIHAADGVPVLAHPCHIRDNPFALINELTNLGLMGLEVYYPTSTPRQTEMFLSIARQKKLMVTCGSDFHGKNRPGVPLGCAWRDVPDLEQTYETLSRRIGTLR